MPACFSHPKLHGHNVCVRAHEFAHEREHVTAKPRNPATLTHNVCAFYFFIFYQTTPHEKKAWPEYLVLRFEPPLVTP